METQPFLSSQRYTSEARTNSKIPNNDLGLGTSGASLKSSQSLAISLRQQILVLAQKACSAGITISEAERLIEGHKGHSISPRFAELIKCGKLVRIPLAPGHQTNRFPCGIPRFMTRYDEQSRRNVNVHWLPEFAPVCGESPRRGAR